MMRVTLRRTCRDHGPVYPAAPLPGRNAAVLRFVTSEDVHRACAWPALVAALRAAHRGPRPLIARCSIEGDVRGAAQTYLNLPAVLPGVAMGTKLVTILPGNPERGAGVPAVQAVYALCDGGDGSPAAVIDGTALTYRKTAADSALGSQILSREDARVLVVAGAGGLAPFLARAHLATRPSLTTVLVWNRTAHRADALARALRDEGVDATATTDLAAAVRRADIVSCATAATAPLVSGDWLRPGAHLDLVGGFTPAMRECDDAAVRRARLFVDEASVNVEQCGDLIDPIRRGVVPRAKIEGDLFDLCRPGSTLARRAGDVTLFKNGGGGHLDLFTALFVRDRLSRPEATPDA
jgi:ornithine cyclodeaminase/alanine dehydrogenase-like protein (mu-crystallin family)